MSEQEAGGAEGEAKDVEQPSEEGAAKPEEAAEGAEPTSEAPEASASEQEEQASASDPESDAASEPTSEEAEMLAAMRDAIDAVNSGEGATEAQAVVAEAAEQVSLPDLAGAGGNGELPGGITLLSDVNLKLKVELGRTRMHVDDVLKLGEGSVVELDKLAGDPVDIYVNDRPVARGEVLVLNENFCVRINEVLPSIAGDVEDRGAA